jgi:kinesin family protein 5
MNADSSRSHAVFTISVMKRHISSHVRETGKLFVVDLAGSEMAKKTAVTGRRLEEAKAINRVCKE